MNQNDQRPPVGVAHVVLQTDRMDDSVQFMRTIGMRPIFDGPEVSVYEMRGGTHLILTRRDKIVAGGASFDLMVDDLQATHQRFTSLGLAASPIEARPAIEGRSSHSSQVTRPASLHDAELGAPGWYVSRPVLSPYCSVRPTRSGSTPEPDAGVLQACCGLRAKERHVT